MGTSTDGILCYGFEVRDDDGYVVESGYPEWLEATDGSFDGFLANLVGLESPKDFNKEKFDSDPVYAKTWADYWAKKRGLAEEFGVELVEHCSGEYTMYILAAAGSCSTASRGSALSFGQNINAKPEWREKLFAFCEKAGIKFEEPQFLLCSYWG